MSQFQGSHGPIQDLQSKRRPTGLQPYLDLPPSKKRATDRPKDYERSMDLIVAAVIAMLVVILAGIFGAQS